jgi:hypothetical protein
MENFQVQFSDLLKRAVSEPGTVSAAYSAFHNYSIGNQLAALFQCTLRKIPSRADFHVEKLEQQGPLREARRKGNLALHADHGKESGQG